MANVLSAYGIKVTLAKTEVINGVEYISLADPVVPDKTVDLGIKLKFTTIKILVIEKR